MNQMDLEQIVSLVTQQVMAVMDKQGAVPVTQDCEKVLVIGKTDKPLPKELSRDCAVMDIADYCTHKDILRYSKVVVTKLTITQLADIALGRTGDEVSCAVVYALLSGVDVILLEDALTFRRFKDKGSNALYNLLEQYVNTLQVFGVKIHRPKQQIVLAEAKPAKFSKLPAEVPQGTVVPNASRLITEREARQLVTQGNAIRLPAEAIITPLARDVFSQAGVSVIKD